jgi:hypothetical protein
VDGVEMIDELRKGIVLLLGIWRRAWHAQSARFAEKAIDVPNLAHALVIGHTVNDHQKRRIFQALGTGIIQQVI